MKLIYTLVFSSMLFYFNSSKEDQETEMQRENKISAYKLISKNSWYRSLQNGNIDFRDSIIEFVKHNYDAELEYDKFTFLNNGTLAYEPLWKYGRCGHSWFYDNGKWKLMGDTLELAVNAGFGLECNYNYIIQYKVVPVDSNYIQLKKLKEIKIKIENFITHAELDTANNIYIISSVPVRN